MRVCEKRIDSVVGVLKTGKNRRDGAVVKSSALQSVDLGFIS